ncbi:ABC transporter substrate-binding protein [Pararhizobium mangrovi]|nr:ABC transporter substrate-binding protein [Pararhizobium mangrovi]
MKRLLASLALTGILAMPAVAADQVDLTVLHAWPQHAKWEKEIAKRFMADHPNVHITFQAPSVDYGEGLVSVIRQNMAGDPPDVFMVGSHLLPNLVTRGIVQPLDDVMQGKDMEKLGYTENVLKLGQVNGKQYGLPWTDSTTVMFYNKDLVKKAGGDPDNMPTTWDGTIALAKKINALGSDTHGIYYTLGDDDWMVQNLLATNGIYPVTKDGKIAFSTDKGKKAIEVFQRLIQDAGQQPIADKAARQEMYAGKLGIYFNSAAVVRSFDREIGDRFPWGAAQMPSLGEKGNVASGGMGVVVLSKDPAKRKAAFDYILYGTGAKSQAYIAKQTGYIPINTGSAELLKDFYQKNPNYKTSPNQLDRALGWFSWPGSNGVKISQIIMDDMTSVANGEMTADEASAKMTDQIKPLIETK